jgi:hypothetical protein
MSIKNPTWEQMVVDYIKSTGDSEPADIYSSIFVNKISWEEFNEFINKMIKDNLVKIGYKNYYDNGSTANYTVSVLKVIKGN